MSGQLLQLIQDTVELKVKGFCPTMLDLKFEHKTIQSYSQHLRVTVRVTTTTLQQACTVFIYPRLRLNYLL